MKHVKALIGDDDSAVARCPDCRRRVRLVRASERSHPDQPLVVECECGASFRVVLERRRFLRVAAHQRGVVRRGEAPGVGATTGVVIRSISVGGMRFDLEEDVDLRAGEVVTIEYGGGDRIARRDVVILRVIDRQVFARIREVEEEST